MTSAVVNLTEENTILLNLIKAKFSLHNKSDAMNLVVREYAKEALEPELRPEYVQKLRKIMKEKPIVYKSLADMMRSIEEG